MGMKLDHQKQTNNTVSPIDDYMQKIAEIIDEETSKAKKNAEQQASQIITEAKKQAQQITQEAMTKAEQESTTYMTALKQKAEETANKLEAEARSKAEAESEVIIAKSFDEAEQIIAKARQAAEKEASTILADSRKDAEQMINEAIRQREKAADEARNNMLKQFEECSIIITEAKYKLEQTIQVAEEETSKELERRGVLIAQLTDAQESGQPEKPEVKAKASLTPEETNSDGLYHGQIGLEIVSDADFGQIGRFIENLRKLPNLELISLGSSESGRTLATVTSVEPIPLKSMLQEISLVNGVSQQGNNIQVELATRAEV